jgi:hypothetical protein
MPDINYKMKGNANPPSQGPPLRQPTKLKQPTKLGGASEEAKKVASTTPTPSSNLAIL